MQMYQDFSILTPNLPTCLAGSDRTVQEEAPGHGRSVAAGMKRMGSGLPWAFAGRHWSKRRCQSGGVSDVFF